MGQVVSRRALLTRAGIGTGAGVFALLGATAAPAFATRPSPISRTCASCASPSASPSTGCTSWVNTPKAVDSSDTADLIRAIRSQEQEHYGLLAPLLNGTAPVDDDYTYTFPAGALRSFARASRLRARPRGDAARHRHRRRRRRPTIAASPSRWRAIVARRRPALLRALGAHGRLGRPGQAAARPRHRRRRQSALPVPLQLGGSDDSHLLLCAAPAARCSSPSRSSRPSLSARAPAPAAHRRR